MNPWDLYQARSNVRGSTRRESVFNRTVDRMNRQIPSMLSYQVVFVDGERRDLVVLDSDNNDTKSICTLPGEDVRHGGSVEWMDHHWLITERDAFTEVYTKAIMRQCNYLLRWINANDEIIERWCIVEDGTRYLIGEYTDSLFVTTRGDSRITVILPKDSETIALGRDSRFIVDDYDSPSPLAYRLTKPFKLGGSYDENGILTFVMMECNTEYDDNLELHIADYYKHFPRDNVPEDNPTPPVITTDGGRDVWI